MPEEHKKAKDELRHTGLKENILFTKMEADCYSKMCPHVYIAMQRKGRVMEY